MMYTEGVMTLHKGYMGQQDDVDDLPRRVYDTLDWYICDDKWGVMTYLEGFMTLQKGYVGR